MESPWTIISLKWSKWAGTISSSYWTSGVNFGTQNATTYGWCSTGKLVNRKLWAEGEPQNSENSHCVALTMMEGDPRSSGLEAVYCDFSLPLICQFPYYNFWYSVKIKLEFY